MLNLHLISFLQLDFQKLSQVHYEEHTNTANPGEYLVYSNGLSNAKLLVE